MPNPIVIEFDGSSTEEQRTINFGNQSGWKANEYNVSVFNQAGETVTGAVSGMVSVEAYSPFADRPETTDSTVDLSTGCRKFTLFFATINRAVFSVAGLAGGQVVRVTAIRGKG